MLSVPPVGPPPWHSLQVDSPGAPVNDGNGPVLNALTGEPFKLEMANNAPSETIIVSFSKCIRMIFKVFIEWLRTGFHRVPSTPSMASKAAPWDDWR